MDKRKICDLGLCLGIGGLFLLLLSKSSPLYPMNDWVDVHCFLTMGKGMAQGLVPYRDLYEQKGPVLYFLFALASSAQGQSFWGVFALEWAAMGAYLYHSLRILRLYTQDSPWLYLTLPVLAAGICVSPAYAHGTSAEMLCLWLIPGGLYPVLAALGQERLLRPWESFCIGLGAAVALYVKFTFLGFHLGLALAVAVWYLAFEKKPLELAKISGCFLAGLACVSALVFGYFAFHGAAGDFLEVYFYNNLFLYPQKSPDRWELMWECLGNGLGRNGTWALPVEAGLLWMLLRLPEKPKESFVPLLSFLGLALATCWSGRDYVYYALILAGFAPLGLGLLCYILSPEPGTHRAWVRFCPDLRLLAVCLTGVLLALCWRYSGNTYLLGKDREDMPQYQFADTIRQREDATLLNFGFLDGGFYYAADVLPTARFFCTLNIPLAGMRESQRQIIRDGAVDFVVTRVFTLEAYGVGENYTLVQQASQYFEGVDYTYYLYQRRDTLP